MRWKWGVCAVLSGQGDDRGHYTVHRHLTSIFALSLCLCLVHTLNCEDEITSLCSSARSNVARAVSPPYTATLWGDIRSEIRRNEPMKSGVLRDKNRFPNQHKTVKRGFDARWNNDMRNIVEKRPCKTIFLSSQKELQTEALNEQEQNIDSWHIWRKETWL